jgi:D-beta-D-heptose 7-phosphate kinase/D-beta-D-heptose 1-phosphate adenosyltransferase
MTETESLKAVVDQFRGKRVLCVGEAVVDKRLLGETSRLSPDGPVPIVDISREEQTHGAFGLVAEHILALGGDAIMCSVVGRDPEGQFFLDQMANLNLGTKGIFQSEVSTPQITRIESRGHQMLRLERMYECARGARTGIDQRILEFVAATIDRADVLLFLDYNTGLLGPELVPGIIRLAVDRGVPIIARPSAPTFTCYQDATIAKMSLSVASGITGISVMNPTSMNIIGKKILHDVGCRALYLSWLESTSYLFTSGGVEPLPAPPRLGGSIRSWKNVGSASLAALALAAGATPDLRAVVRVGHVAGGLSAIQPDEGILTLEELRGGIAGG